MPSIKFNAVCDWTQWGDTIKVLGSWNNWSVRDAIPLSTNAEEFPQWTVSADIPISHGQVIAYKYVVVKDDGSFEWETLGGPNREMVSWDKAGVVDNFGCIVARLLAVPCTTGLHAKMVRESIENARSSFPRGGGLPDCAILHKTETDTRDSAAKLDTYPCIERSRTSRVRKSVFSVGEYVRHDVIAVKAAEPDGFQKGLENEEPLLTASQPISYEEELATAEPHVKPRIARVHR